MIIASAHFTDSSKMVRNPLASIPGVHFRVRVDHSVNPAWVGDLVTMLVDRLQRIVHRWQ